MVVLRGDLVCPVMRPTPPFGVHDSIGRRLVLSSYHMSDAALPWYCEQIRARAYAFLSAYPSSAYVLADFLRRSGAEPMGLRAVFLASETLYEYQREVIEALLGPVRAHYGNAERTTWMTTCRAGRYHEDPSYGYTEYVPCGEGAYEIVATGFINRAMPLIRYRTGDVALEPFGWGKACECGSLLPGCQAVIGRVDDLVVTPDGRRIGRLDHVFKGVAHVIAAQIVQHRPDAVTIRVVRDHNYAPGDEADIRRHFAERAGTDIKVDVVYEPALPRTPQGKFRAVISDCHHMEGRPLE
jgi:phenylacetate-CoA ligase